MSVLLHLEDDGTKADKATTLAGYGITDAKIDNGVITLGANSITPLTSHQDISGKADLVDGKVPASQLPSYVDDVLEYDVKDNPASGQTAFPAEGEAGKIYVATSTGKVYRWSGSQYIEIANPDLSGYKPKQAAVSDPTASGTAVSFIDTISQNANGVIAPTKKTVATVVASSSGVGGSAGLMTATDKEKLNGIETGAEVNVIETVKVNGTALTPSSKAVDITVPTGSAASKDVPTSGDAETTQVVMGNDSRLADARTPTAHKSSHATGGSDAIAPSDIGAAASSHTHSASDITSGLAAVATSGSYDDLTNKPTIPTIPTPVAPASATASRQFADALATKGELAAKVALEEFSSGSWAQGSSYSSGDKVFYDGALYLCSSDVSPSSTPPSEDPTHWDQVAVSNLMFLKADRSDIPSPSSTTPSMDGTAAVGASDDYARADHVHPSDTSKADAATTLAGYGITDAHITNGVITLGAATITPLTSHQDISGKANNAAIATVFSTLATYAVGDVVMYEGTRYKCTTAVSVAGAWTGSTNWTAESVQDVLGDVESALHTINYGAQS